MKTFPLNLLPSFLTSKEKYMTWAKGILTLMALATVLSSCSSLANVGIPAGEEFMLGEYQDSGFKVELRNLSNETVKVKAVDKNTGEQTQGFGLSPKGKATVYISKNEKVLLQNRSDVEVVVRAKMNKTVEGMSYRKLDE